MSASETGHAKNMTGFEQAIAIAESMGAEYQPSNPHIQIPNMKNKLTDCKNITEVHRQYKAQDADSTNQRVIFKKRVIPLATRAVAYLKSTGVPQETIQHANSILHLMRGERSAAGKAKIKAAQATYDAAVAAGLTELPEVPKTISVAHTGFHNMADHFANLLELLKTQTLYNPAENDITTQSLQLFLDELNNINSQVTLISTKTQNSLAMKLEEMYHEEKGIPNTFAILKSYVQAVKGSKSPEMKALRRITITYRKK